MPATFTNWSWPVLGRLAAACVLCAAAVLAPPTASAQQKAAPPVPFFAPAKPFHYAPLGVRNSCLVESVRFYDAFRASDPGDAGAWVRVLQWGNHAGNLRHITQGHAVAIFLVRDTLWMYDVNFGFVPLGAPVEKRNDLATVASEILVKYRLDKPAYVFYHQDLLPLPSQPPKQFTYMSGNADVRESTRVASELGRARTTRVVAFVYHDTHAGRMQTSAATLFEFNRRLCVYFPSQGTLTTELHPDSLENVQRVTAIVHQVYPGATGIEWHDSGPWRVLQKAAAVTTPSALDSPKSPPLPLPMQSQM
jgi:hypothetical protein